MLGKLVKYDWKASYLYQMVGGVVYIVATLLLAIVIKSGMENGSGTYYEMETSDLATMQIIGTISASLLWAFAVFGLIILTYILIIRRFYTNMVSDQAYLTLTLPVSARKHMLSKTISGFLLLSLTGVLLAAGLLILLWILVGNQLWSEVPEVIGAVLDEFFNGYSIWYMVNMILERICGLLLIYFSICVGQLFQKHKVWGAIGTYLLIMTVYYITATIFVVVTGLFGEMDTILWMTDTSMNIAGTVLCVVEMCLYFFLGSWILEKRINLE